MERLENWLNVHSNPVNIPKALCSSEHGWASGSSGIASSLLACECQGKYREQAVCLAFQLRVQLWKNTVTDANQSRCSSINPAFHQCPRRPVQMQPFCWSILRYLVMLTQSDHFLSRGSLDLLLCRLLQSLPQPMLWEGRHLSKMLIVVTLGMKFEICQQSFLLHTSFPHQEMLWNFHRYPRSLPLPQLWLGSWLEAFYHVLRSNGRPNEPPTAIKHWRENDSNICRHNMSNRNSKMMFFLNGRLQDLVPNFMLQKCWKVAVFNAFLFKRVGWSSLQLLTLFKIPKRQKNNARKSVTGLVSALSIGKLGEKKATKPSIQFPSVPRLRNWKKSLSWVAPFSGSGFWRQKWLERWMKNPLSSVTNSIFVTKKWHLLKERNGYSRFFDCLLSGFFEARFVRLKKSLPHQCS